MPPSSWFQRFKKRRGLDSIIAKRRTAARQAACSDHDKVFDYLKAVEALVRMYDIPVERMWNSDETRLRFSDEKKEHIVCARGTRADTLTAVPLASGGQAITFIPTANMAGTLRLDFFLLGGKSTDSAVGTDAVLQSEHDFFNRTLAATRNDDEWYPATAIEMVRNVSGCLNQQVFAILIDRFLEMLKAQPEYDESHHHILLLDNCGAHKHPGAEAKLAIHNVHVVYLPPNSTHFLQPLDVLVFGPLKNKARTALNRVKEVIKKRRQRTPASLQEVVLCSTMAAAAELTFKPAIMIKSFMDAGVPQVDDALLVDMPTKVAEQMTEPLEECERKLWLAAGEVLKLPVGVHVFASASAADPKITRAVASAKLSQGGKIAAILQDAMEERLALLGPEPSLRRTPVAVAAAAAASEAKITAEVKQRSQEMLSGLRDGEREMRESWKAILKKSKHAADRELVCAQIQYLNAC